MKQLIFIILALLKSNLYAQNLKVLYSRHSDLPDKEHIKFYTPASLKKITEKKYRYLIKNDTASLFFPLKKERVFQDVDSTVVSKYQTNINIVTIDNRITDIYYINYSKNIYIRKLNIRGTNYDIKDSLPVLKWQILDSVQKMKGFTIQKAVTTYQNKPITAWFAEDIPVNTGPRIFQGLPGLIMKLKMGIYNYEVEKITYLKKTPKIQVPNPQSAYLTTQQYFEIFKKNRHKSQIIKHKCATCPDGL